MALSLWLITTAALLMWLTRYAGLPGSPGLPPARWPEQSRVVRATNMHTLLVFMHPRCPCSRATLGELDVLLAQCRGGLRTIIIFAKPDGTADDWANTDLWRTAESMRGTETFLDHGGAEARRFQAETSGDARLYDKEGQLVFHGGLTLARGHSGDNIGRSTVVALVRGTGTTEGSAPVFGCPIFDEDCGNKKKEGHDG